MTTDDLKYGSFHNWKSFTQAAARIVLNLEVVEHHLVLTDELSILRSRIETIAAQGQSELRTFEFNLSCGGSRRCLNQCTFSIEPEITSQSKKVEDLEGNTFVKVDFQVFASFQGRMRVDTDEALEFAEIIRKGTEALRAIQASLRDDVYWCVETPKNRQERDLKKKTQAEVNRLIEGVAKKNPKVGEVTKVSGVMYLASGQHFTRMIGRRKFMIKMEDSGCTVERMPTRKQP